MMNLYHTHALSPNQCSSSLVQNQMLYKASQSEVLHNQKSPNKLLVAEMMNLYHTHALSPNQCSSILVQTIDAPLPLVWSVVRRFDNPQVYKRFIKSCTLKAGDGVGIGSVRQVAVISGLPARTSTERLDRLDDDEHVMAFSIIGGDHRLVNYRSTTTLHEVEREGGGGGGKGRTVVIESYVVDVPVGSSKEDTCLFTNTIIGCNLKSLANLSEKMAKD